MDELNNILELVRNYIDKKEKTWTPGKDWVQYAGPYFTSFKMVMKQNIFLLQQLLNLEVLLLQ